MMLYSLAKHPEVYEKVKNEIDGLFDDLDSIKYDALKNNMTYSWAFL